MRIQSVRFSDSMWTAIQQSSREQGISASQYIREAAIARMAWENARRDSMPDIDRLLAEVRRITQDE